MTIKRAPRITRKQLEDALSELRMSVAEVSRATEIPRAYLSELRNHDTPLRGEYDAKLRDWLVKQDVFTETSTDETDDAAPRSPQSMPVPARLTAISTIRYALTIDESVPDEVVNSALDMMEENDAELATLFNRQVETGLFGDYSEDSTEAIQQSLAICALNYIVFRSLRGWRVFKAAPSTDNIKKVREVILETFKPQLIEAGLLASESVEQSQEDQSEEVAE